MTDMDRMRGNGGNQFIPPNATCGDLMKSINDQLGDLREWAAEAGQYLDLGEITISTMRSYSGSISVTVSADLSDKPS